MPGRAVGLPGFVAFAVASFGGPLALAALYAPGILDDVTASSGRRGGRGSGVRSSAARCAARSPRTVATSGGLNGSSRRRPAPGWRWCKPWSGSSATPCIRLHDGLDRVRHVAGGECRVPALPTTVGDRHPRGARRDDAGRTSGDDGGPRRPRGRPAGSRGRSRRRRHRARPSASSFALQRPSHRLAAATGQVALLYISGSLPLYLGGEVAEPRTRTVRRGLVIGTGSPPSVSSWRSSRSRRTRPSRAHRSREYPSPRCSPATRWP